MGNKPQPIAEVLKQILSQTAREGHKSAVIEKMWQETAGEKILRHTRISALKRGVLVVNVDSSAWLFQLTLNKRSLLSELKKRLGKDIKDLKFKLGPIYQETYNGRP